MAFYAVQLNHFSTLVSMPQKKEALFTVECLDFLLQVYSIEDSDQCLIGTAEIPVGGIHMDSILTESSLPLKYVAYSHCFGTEAGAAGAATRSVYSLFSCYLMFINC
jgi:seryl-tRNA synthetase